MPDILPVAERRIHDNPAVILHRLPFHEVATLYPDTVKIIPQIPDQPAVDLHRITHGPQCGIPNRPQYSPGAGRGFQNVISPPASPGAHRPGQVSQKAEIQPGFQQPAQRYPALRASAGYVLLTDCACHYLRHPPGISPGGKPYFCGISVIFMSVIYTFTRRKLLSIVRR